MHVSSRTPEGEPARCSVCGASFFLEPSIPLGDCTCPSCGSLVRMGMLHGVKCARRFTHSYRTRSPRLGLTFFAIATATVLLARLVRLVWLYVPWFGIGELIVCGLVVLLLFGRNIPRFVACFLAGLRQRGA